MSAGKRESRGEQSSRAQADLLDSTPVIRCSIRKHVIEDGMQFCDCGGLMLGKTAAKNAHVVTLFWRDQPAPLLQDLRRNRPAKETS